MPNHHPRRHICRARLSFLVALVFIANIASPLAMAGDWPQILGPHRNGEAENETLANTWPATGPVTRWTVPLGEGYAGPAVVGHRVIVFHRVENKERIEAFDTQTGKSLWRADFPAGYRGGVNSDHGPRCVPLVHDGRVFGFGAAGDLHCVELAGGKHVWSRSAYADYQGDEGFFGAGSSPIVVGNKVLVNVGGRGGAGLVAFDAKSGETAWKISDEAASYSSPTQTTIDGQPTVIFVTRYNCVAIDPETGGERFRFKYGKRGPTVNAAMPLVFDKRLFLSSSYGVGAVCARLTPTAATPLWSNDDTMSSQYSTCVYRDGYLFGVHGREDVGEASLRCLDAQTGKVQWSVEDFGVANLILAGDRLLILKTTGELVLAAASPQKFQSLATAKVTSDTTRALPALSGGCLFLRTNKSTNTGELRCIVVGRADR